MSVATVAGTPASISLCTVNWLIGSGYDAKNWGNKLLAKEIGKTLLANVDGVSVAKYSE
jgi:hypothetical protein